jgi:hypothetical protein
MSPVITSARWTENNPFFCTGQPKLFNFSYVLYLITKNVFVIEKARGQKLTNNGLNSTVNKMADYINRDL